METLFILLFVLWVMIPVFFQYNDTGGKAFALTTIVMWVLVFFIPDFFMVSVWLIASMLFGVIAGMVCFHNEGAQGWLWWAMAVISAIQFFLFVK